MVACVGKKHEHSSGGDIRAASRDHAVASTASSEEARAVDTGNFLLGRDEKKIQQMEDGEDAASAMKSASQDFSKISWSPATQQEQQHASLAQKSSLPLPEISWRQQPGLGGLQPRGGGSPGVGGGGGGGGGHVPICRTVSDSYAAAQRQQQHLQMLQQQHHQQQQHHFFGSQRRTALATSRRKLESEDSSYDSDHDNTTCGVGQSHDFLSTAVTASLTGLSSSSSGLRISVPVTVSAAHVSKSHDDVSRTPSETLAAEFAEYVTLRKATAASPTTTTTFAQPPPQQQQHQYKQQQQQPLPDSDQHFDLEQIIRDPAYNSKVEFALRLGYSESLMQRALMKLGHGAGQNQILEELIRLQKTKTGKDSPEKVPLESTNSSSSLTPASVASIPAASSSPSSSSGLPPPPLTVSVAPASSPSSGSVVEEDELLPIVIDGSNVAMSHGNKDIFSCKGIRICVEWFQARGHRQITVFVPKWRKESSRPDTPIRDQHILTDLERDRILSFTPSRQVSGRRYVCHDDRYILNLAAATGAIVVTNDNYRELINEKPEYKKVIEEKILMYSFVNDIFMPPDDPLGRNGPTLDQFLRKRPAFGDLQPCPYGKKCTYGNKCKFFHAERGNQPHKSVTDKLKEHSSQKINEVRARGNSRDSSPGDSLTRTKSMQPLHRSESAMYAQQEKAALCRTRSTVPHLTVAQSEVIHQQKQKQLQQYWQHQRHLPPPPTGPPPPPQQQHLMLQPPPPTTTMMQPMMDEPPSSSSLWSSTSVPYNLGAIGQQQQQTVSVTAATSNPLPPLSFLILSE